MTATRRSPSGCLRRSCAASRALRAASRSHTSLCLADLERGLIPAESARHGARVPGDHSHSSRSLLAGTCGSCDTVCHMALRSLNPTG
eukprot:3514054-Rhodomonas_salina.2